LALDIFLHGWTVPLWRRGYRQSLLCTGAHHPFGAPQFVAGGIAQAFELLRPILEFLTGTKQTAADMFRLPRDIRIGLIPFHDSTVPISIWFVMTCTDCESRSLLLFPFNNPAKYSLHLNSYRNLFTKHISK